MHQLGAYSKSEKQTTPIATRAECNCYVLFINLSTSLMIRLRSIPLDMPLLLWPRSFLIANHIPSTTNRILSLFFDGSLNFKKAITTSSEPHMRSFCVNPNMKSAISSSDGIFLPSLEARAILKRKARSSSYIGIFLSLCWFFINAFCSSRLEIRTVAKETIIVEAAAIMPTAKDGLTEERVVQTNFIPRYINHITPPAIKMLNAMRNSCDNLCLVIKRRLQWMPTQ